MKKKQDSSVRASALQIARSLALVSLSVVLITSSLAQRSGINTPVPGDSAYASQGVNAYASLPQAGPVTVTATGGNHGPTDYPTLGAAFAAINVGTHQGDINVAIVGDTTETTSAVLDASGGSANYTSISIEPSGGAARTVSGAIAAGSPLIDFNGATNVTIDGLGTGGNALTLSNTTASATASTSTIRFIDGAQNNIVTRCTVLGSSNSATGIAGGNVFFSTTTGVGNNNNTVSFCNLGPVGTNLPTKAVMALGTAANPNTGNLIDNNNIFDFFSATLSVTGISIQTNSNNWTVSNNRIYQTAPRTFTDTALRYSGITIASSSSFFTVTENIIGFGATDGSGTTTISGSTNEFRGIDIALASITTATSIQGNIISGIDQTTARNSTAFSNAPFIGIEVGVGDGLFNIGNVTGNQIGSLDGSSSISVTATSTTANTSPVMGVFDFSFRNDTIANNSIGTIAINSGGTGTAVGFRGVAVQGTSGQSVIVNNNTIGGTATGSITDNIVGTYAMYGIQNTGSSTSPNLSATGNS